MHSLFVLLIPILIDLHCNFQTQLAEQKKITEDYRGQLLAMESEMEALKDLANANKEVLKSRTKNMVDQVDALKERYENLEKRRKQEGEGYQADIHLLKQKLRHVEQQLVRAAVTRSKGKNHNIYFVYYFFPKCFHFYGFRT